MTTNTTDALVKAAQAVVENSGPSVYADTRIVSTSNIDDLRAALAAHAQQAQPPGEAEIDDAIDELIAAQVDLPFDLSRRNHAVDSIKSMLRRAAPAHPEPRALGSVHKPVLYHLDDGKVARAVRIGGEGIRHSLLVVDLASGDGPTVVGKPNWFDAGYVATYGGLVPECAEQGTGPGQWSYGVLAVKHPEPRASAGLREAVRWYVDEEDDDRASAYNAMCTALRMEEALAAEQARPAVETETLAEVQKERDNFREGLELICDAFAELGIDSDEHGGPHASDCVRKLGKERNQLRAELEGLRSEQANAGFVAPAFEANALSSELSRAEAQITALRAGLALVAHELRSAWEKRDDAPRSAEAHLQCAAFTLFRLRLDVPSTEVEKLRAAVWSEMREPAPEGGASERAVVEPTVSRDPLLGKGIYPCDAIVELAAVKAAFPSYWSVALFIETRIAALRAGGAPKGDTK